MEGMPNHSKDALEFLLHDLKHMENFIDNATYKEQVGFFRCMLKLSDVKADTAGIFVDLMSFYSYLIVQVSVSLCRTYRE
jgi:hypothetical protein